MHVFKLTIFFLLTLSLFSCGGGGSSGGGNGDTTAPLATITFPPTLSLTDGDQITVQGTASDDSEITTLRVNGIDAASSDGFSNWQVVVPLTPGSNTLQVETGDIGLNSSSNAAQVLMTAAGPLMTNSQDLLLDEPNNRLLVLDLGRRAVMAVNLDNGERSVISDRNTPDNNNLLFSPQAMVLDSANNRLLVLQRFEGVLSIDLTPGPNLGKRTIISNNSTPDNANPFVRPTSLVLDSANDRLLVTDSGANAAILAVSLTDGARSIISNDTTPFITNPFDSPQDLVLDNANDQLLVVDSGLDAIIAVDLINGGGNTIGRRTTISDNATPDTLNPFFQPLSLVLDPANNRLLVSDSVFQYVLAVDLNPGVGLGGRTIFSSNTHPDSDNPFSFPRSLALDSANNRLLAGNEGISSIHAVDLTDGSRAIVSDSSFPNRDDPFLAPTDLAFDISNNQLFVTDSRKSAVLAVDLNTGERSIVSNFVIPDNINDFSDPAGLVLDIANNRLLVADNSLDAVLSVDLSPGPDRGKRSIISDSTTPDGVNPFDRPTALVLDSADNRLLVLDSGLDAVLAIDLAPGPDRGKRSIVSDAITPDNINAFVSPSGLMLDSANNRLLVVDTGLDAVLAVDLTPGPDRGKRSIVSDNSTPNNINQFFNPTDLVLDSTNNRLLMLDTIRGLNAVLAVDLNPGSNLGARTIITGRGLPGNNANGFLFPVALALDSLHDRLLVLEGGAGMRALIAINLKTGERVILSK